MGELRAQIVRDEDTLAKLEEAWWALWRRVPSATPFQSPAWLLPWWRTFRPGALCTLVIHDRQRLVALAPMYCEDEALGRRLLPLGISISDYLDVLIDPTCPEAAVALLHAAGDAEWETWSLEELAPGAAALLIPSSPDQHDATHPQSACPVLRLPAAVERLGTAVPSRKLRKLRMARNRAARREGFSVETVSPSDVSTFLDDLFRLHGARWEERGETGVLGEERVRRFHAAAAPALLAAGLARFTIMRLEGLVVGTYYGLCHNRKAYAYLGGFDPAFAFESPGTILIGSAIETAVEEGCEEFHFLRGQESYKYEWGAVDRWSVCRTLIREAARV